MPMLLMSAIRLLMARDKARVPYELISVDADHVCRYHAFAIAPHERDGATYSEVKRAMFGGVYAIR